MYLVYVWCNFSVCMMYVFVCIVCICLYFWQQKLLGVLIWTHSARYIQYIQNTYKIKPKYNINTWSYRQHTCNYAKKIRNHFFGVCFFVYVCDLYLYVLYLSVSIFNWHTWHIQQWMYVYVCACIVCMCMYVCI